MAYDVFISHSSKDKRIADATCASLEQAGIRCWVAPRDILPGATWGKSIVDAIHASRVMVLVFSANANNSPQIEREVERAVSKGVPVIPFRVEDVKPSGALEYFLGTPHWLDALTPPPEQHQRRLVDVVRQVLAASPVEMGLPVPNEFGTLPSTASRDRSGRPRSWIRGPQLMGLAIVALLLVAFPSYLYVRSAYGPTPPPQATMPATATSSVAAPAAAPESVPSSTPPAVLSPASSTGVSPPSTLEPKPAPAGAASSPGGGPMPQAASEPAPGAASPAPPAMPSTPAPVPAPPAAPDLSKAPAATPTVASPAATTPPAPAAAPGAMPPQLAVRPSTSTPGTAAHAPDVRRFDGVWIGSLVCASTDRGLPGWKYRFVAKVANGALHGERGHQGQPGSETWDGTVKADGTIEVLQKGLSGDSARDPFHRPAGTEFQNTYAGKLSESHGTLTRLNRASCNIDFVPQATAHQ